MLKDSIEKLARELHEEAILNRHYLHAHPELSFQEYNTANFVATKLNELKIPFEKKADTGIVALLKGTLSDSDKVVALRADLDALPMQETNTVTYRSQNNGVMHACGHDVHTSSLLATAGILSSLKTKFSGSIKFIFQPGEEKLPGGASIMIKERVLEDPHPSWIIGQHVMPELPVGKVGFRSGLYMASNDEIYITVIGKGGHGATPHLNIDPVLITCQMISTLRQIISRHANPITPSVLSFGKIIANGSTNVIPDKVTIEGTFRTLDEKWRAGAHEKIKKLTKSIVEGLGGKCIFEIKKGYPALLNNKKLTAATRLYAEDFLGNNNVVDLDIWMAAEDFAYYSQLIPGCFYLLGTGNAAKGIISGVHTPTFDID